MEFASNPTATTAMRLEALTCLKLWTEDPSYDRVVGRIRSRSPQDPTAARRLLQRRIGPLLDEGNRELETTLADIVRDLELDVPDVVFARWLGSVDQPLPTRIAAMKTLAARDSAQLPELLSKALDADDPLLRIQAVRLLATRDPQQAVQWLKDRRTQIELPELQAGIQQLGLINHPAAGEMLSSLVEDWSQGQLPQELFLDVQQAAHQRADADLLDKLKPLVETLDTEIGLHGGDAERGERIFRNHVSRHNASAVISPAAARNRRARSWAGLVSVSTERICIRR